MLIASIIKEMRLLSRDLHGVAVLFIMPILFMLIMSAALSNDNALSNRSEIVLLSEKNQLNDNFLTQLKKENLAVKQASLSELTQYQAELQASKFDLLILNPNKKQTALSEEQALQLWLNPSVDRSWLLGVKGVLQKHYSQLRLNDYLADNHITLENNKRKPIKDIQNKVNKDLDRKFAQINDYLAKDLWQEIYVNRHGKEVSKPSSVQHSVPAWLIFGMFFIMIPLSNVMAMERQTNTLTRLRMARASALSLIIAKLIDQPITIRRHGGARLFCVACARYACVYAFRKLVALFCLIRYGKPCRTRLWFINQCAGKNDRTRGGVGRGRHNYHGGHWRYYGACLCDARNHANYFTIFPHGMGIKRFPKFIVKPISPQPNSTTTLFIKWIWGNHIAFSDFNLSTTIN